MVRRSRLTGDIRLRKMLRAIHQTVDNEVRGAMQEGAEKILASMKEFVPKDTGAGAAALTAYVAPSGLDAQIGLRGKKANRRYFYLRFLEYGTKGNFKGQENGRRKGRAANKTDGSNWFGKSPDIPAMPAHPWLRPAMDVNREVVLADIRAAVGRTLDRASRGQ
ncbi:HK97-gp10 family putative phage morphogenesis protein [Pseudomonas putida]|uniref:HK97-gp10 family putative phage morphogenesis protein n=1 Tax=Pseudomonas putida TaxID=303 RepID=UPI0005357E45|nr:HK97-gp10 family putative phage morphogenesis protein [Pseudomonas putida]